MANKQKIAAKSKTKASKYSKLMQSASKELADKKKALAKAERALAKATKTHQELLQETARLDMLERSLKALVEGTEPPQNIRYVYTYPQWVWNGYPYGWYWTGNGYTYTVNNPNSVATTYNSLADLQGGSAGNFFATTGTTNCFNVATVTTGTLDASASSLTYNNAGLAGTTAWTTPSAPQWQTVSSTADLTVDLSTGATEGEGNGGPTASEPETTAVGLGG